MRGRLGRARDLDRDAQLFKAREPVEARLDRAVLRGEGRIGPAAANVDATHLLLRGGRRVPWNGLRGAGA